MCRIQDHHSSSTWSSGSRNGQCGVELHPQHVVWLRYFLKLRIPIETCLKRIPDPGSGNLCRILRKALLYFSREPTSKRNTERHFKYDQKQFIQQHDCAATGTLNGYLRAPRVAEWYDTTIIWSNYLNFQEHHRLNSDLLH